MQEAKKSSGQYDLESRINARISKLLAIAKNYKKTTDHPSTRILLEIYGFALAVAHDSNDMLANEYLFDTEVHEAKIAKAIENFVLKDIRGPLKVEASNLAKNLKGFKLRLDTIRLKCEKEFGEKTIEVTALHDYLKYAHAEFEVLFNDIFEYVKGLLGPVPSDCPHVFLTMGSFAKGLFTPYSSVNYMVLTDKHNDAILTYFTNFADVFEMIMISFGESPVSEAKPLLKEVESSLYITSGIHQGEHTRPQATNRLYGLINTPSGLLEQLPNKIIHAPKNHLTSALLVTRMIGKASDGALAQRYHALFSKALMTSAYQKCLKALLQEDKRNAVNHVSSLENTYFKKELGWGIDIKEITHPAIHIGYGLALYIKSLGHPLALSNDFFETLHALKAEGYIHESLYHAWQKLVEHLYTLRLNKQSQKHRAEPTVMLGDLDKHFSVEAITTTLTNIATAVDSIIQKLTAVPHLLALSDVIQSYEDGQLEKGHVPLSKITSSGVAKKKGVVPKKATFGGEVKSRGIVTQIPVEALSHPKTLETVTTILNNGVQMTQVDRDKDRGIYSETLDKANKSALHALNNEDVSDITVNPKYESVGMTINFTALLSQGNVGQGERTTSTAPPLSNESPEELQFDTIGALRLTIKTVLDQGYKFKLIRSDHATLQIICTKSEKSTRASFLKLRKLEKNLKACVKKQNLAVTLIPDDEKDILIVTSKDTSVINRIATLFRQVSGKALSKLSPKRPFFAWPQTEKDIPKKEVSVKCRLQ